MKQTPSTSSILSLQRLRALLQLEYEAEKEQYRQQAEAMGVIRKIKRGICWHPLKIGRSYYNSLNQLVVEVERTEDVEIESVFEYGKPVSFFTGAATNAIKFLGFTATVSYVDQNRMVVALPSPDALNSLVNATDVGVQLYFDETSYRLMFESLDKVIASKSGRLAHLRELFHGPLKAEELSFTPLRLPWLNQSQEQAVNSVLRAKDVVVVHGPPGTGKTTTLVEAIYETLHRESQVLVCAQSNMAVDWIAEKLVDRGVNVLRIGNPHRVNDKMLSFTYERRFESHPDYDQLWSIRRTIRELYSRKRKGGENLHQKINSLKERATELELRINAQLFGEARVIASTLTSSAHRVLTGMKFSTLFIDEAAQALEPACWIAIRKAGRVVLAGDHQQLPPTLKCPEAIRGGLDHTLMQHLVKQTPQAVTLLNLQYRMNEAIMRFSSDWFYGGALTSAPEVKYRGILDYDTPMEWVNTENLHAVEEFVGDSFGRINKPEAQLALQQLESYVERIGKERLLDERIDFGLISPYKAQVQYLRQLVRRSVALKPFRSQITVNTVDGFQGQERDVVLISLVRANEAGQIGFLSDLRRMNVAITRARMKLFILGDASTLCKHPFYKKLWEYIQGL
ncbi:MAG: AAA domain-containing protein [Phocaeicola sp.]